MEDMIIKGLYRGCIQRELNLLNNLDTQFTFLKTGSTDLFHRYWVKIQIIYEM